MVFAGRCAHGHVSHPHQHQDWASVIQQGWKLMFNDLFERPQRMSSCDRREKLQVQLLTRPTHLMRSHYKRVSLSIARMLQPGGEQALILSRFFYPSQALIQLPRIHHNPDITRFSEDESSEAADERRKITLLSLTVCGKKVENDIYSLPRVPVAIGLLDGVAANG